MKKSFRTFLWSLLLFQANAISLESLQLPPVINKYSDIAGDIVNDFFGITDSPARELFEEFGYPGKTHRVVTDDGYILTVYRIPYGNRCGPDQPRKPPVILWHGLAGCSHSFIVTNKSLGFMLADDCYDVWMPNSRGNFESKLHVFLNVNSKEFWNFSWHEIGVYDVPAVIDLVKMVTGKSRMHFIGHSEGNTIFFVYASLFPVKSAQEIISMHALGPTVYIRPTRSNFTSEMASHFKFATQLADALGWVEFPGHNDFLAAAMAATCRALTPRNPLICGEWFFSILQYNREDFIVESMTNITKFIPSGCSVKEVLHFLQILNTGQFRQYDYGRRGNRELYGSAKPPKYPISKIRVPIYLHYGLNDIFASVGDVNKLARETQTSTLIRIPRKNFGHLDFIFSRYAPRDVYTALLAKLNKY